MITTNYSVSEKEPKNYTTAPNIKFNDYPEELFASNVIDIGDSAEYEHAEAYNSNENKAGFLENIKKFFI